METLKYKVINSEKQYDNYCKILEELIFEKPKNKGVKEEISLLTLLIEKYDAEHNIFEEKDPVVLLKSLMKDHKMNAVDLAALLNISEGLASDMLNYKRGLSMDAIKILSEKFKLRQEAFNRPYELRISLNPKIQGAKIMNSRKAVAVV
jgi:HTH-type transcriptional regulator/antitoxin HigA